LQVKITVGGSGTMKIKTSPVKAYKTPSYPSMETASLNPDLLKKLPERWRHNKAVVAAVAVISCISLSGCTSARLMGEVETPAFITEEEALSIIKNEALKHGVNLDDTPAEKSIKIRRSSGSSNSSENTYIEYVEIDISDNEKNIAVGYNRYGDSELYYNKTADEGIPYNIGVFSYPTQEVYELEKKINNDSNISSKQDTLSKEAKAVIEEDLREQVKDFIEWLRGQGVI
jgi:hypothetical protein